MSPGWQGCSFPLGIHRLFNADGLLPAEIPLSWVLGERPSLHTGAGCLSESQLREGAGLGEAHPVPPLPGQGQCLGCSGPGLAGVVLLASWNPCQVGCFGKAGERCSWVWVHSM